MRRRLVYGLMGALTTLLGDYQAARAKPPGMIPVPEAEFRVLSSVAQEFNQPDEANGLNVFLPRPGMRVISDALAAAGGSFLPPRTSPHGAEPRKLRLDWSWTRMSIYAVGEHVAPVTTIPFRQIRTILAPEVLKMAEAHWHAGDWDEAKRWYDGTVELYPDSPEATLAQSRLERMRLQRLLAEAGEEQSEEPPMAGPEYLLQMPRVLRR